MPWWIAVLLGGCFAPRASAEAELRDRLEAWGRSDGVVAARLVVHRCGEPVFD